MNGPFCLSDHGARVLDASYATVAEGYGDDEETERKNAEMICAALNAVYYIAKATGVP